MADSIGIIGGGALGTLLASRFLATSADVRIVTRSGGSRQEDLKRDHPSLRLGSDFGSKVFFAAITVDPLADTPPVLKRYANAHGADLGGWAFLTGTSDQISDIAHRYGIYYKKQPGDDVDHTFLTSVIDPNGTLRVQYLGVRFDPEEFLRDIRSLLREGK